MKSKILIVEDESEIADTRQYALALDAFTTFMGYNQTGSPEAIGARPG